MRVLLISYGRWHGPARLPRALKRVGFEVGMVCHPSNMAAKTKFVDQFFPSSLNSEQEAMRDLENAISVYRPDIIIPGLEPAVIALLEILKRHNLDEEGVQAVRRSIFDPDKRRYFYSKIDLLHALAERGVRTPPQRELFTLGDADAFIQEHGYPVLLKPDTGYAGTGIAFCYDEAELLTALRSHLKPGNMQRWCIQKMISGPTAMLQYFAADGKVKLAYSLARDMTHPETKGPSTVVRLIENKEMESAGVQVADLMVYSGLGSVQFVLPSGDSGEAYMFEANMRIGVSMHLGEIFGPDLCRALYQHHYGLEIIQSPPKIGVTVALYPQEALRDPNSEYMKGIVDKPTDDPALLAFYERQIEKKWGVGAKA